VANWRLHATIQAFTFVVFPLAWLPRFGIFSGRFLGGNRPRSLYFRGSWSEKWQL